MDLASPDQADLGGHSAGTSGVSPGLEEMHTIYSWKTSKERGLGALHVLSLGTVQQRSRGAGPGVCRSTGTAWGVWGTGDHPEDLTGLGPLACCSLAGALKTWGWTRPDPVLSVSVTGVTASSLGPALGLGGESCSGSKLTKCPWWNPDMYSQIHL